MQMNRRKTRVPTSRIGRLARQQHAVGIGRQDLGRRRVGRARFGGVVAAAGGEQGED